MREFCLKKQVPRSRAYTELRPLRMQRASVLTHLFWSTLFEVELEVWIGGNKPYMFPDMQHIAN